MEPIETDFIIFEVKTGDDGKLKFLVAKQSANGVSTRRWKTVAEMSALKGHIVRAMSLSHAFTAWKRQLAKRATKVSLKGKFVAVMRRFGDFPSSTDKAWIASKVKAVFNECAGNTRVREDVWRLLFFCEQFIDAHDENGDPLPNQRSEESYSVEELQVVIRYLIGKLSKMDAEDQ